MDKIQIWTDGAASPNPGPGGWGVVMKFRDRVKEISGGEKMTTNNRMELLAVIMAMEAIKVNHHPIEIYSDSKYVIDSIN
jgi:ribonuclease HI